MQVTDKTGMTQEINEGDKIIISLYDWHTGAKIETMDAKAYEPHEVIKQGGNLGIIWGIREEFTPLSSFWMPQTTFEKV